MKSMDREYTLLFNGITDALQQIEELKLRLETLQQQAEQIVIDKNEEEAVLFVAKDSQEVS